MRVNGPGKAVELTLIKNEQAGQSTVQPTVEKETFLKSAVAQTELMQATAKENESQPVRLEDSVELANTAMQISSYNLQFRVHEESGRVQVKVIDSQSGEVLKEIPSEQMLEISANIKEMLESFDKMVGVLVDEFV